MKLNYESIYEEAKRKNISPALIIKQLIGYRNSTAYEKLLGDHCSRCSRITKSPWTQRNEMCGIIGVMKDDTAYIIDSYAKCRELKK